MFDSNKLFSGKYDKILFFRKKDELLAFPPTKGKSL